MSGRQGAFLLLVASFHRTEINQLHSLAENQSIMRNFRLRTEMRKGPCDPSFEFASLPLLESIVISDNRIKLTQCRALPTHCNASNYRK